MAVETSSEPGKVLDGRFAPIAGAVSMALTFVWAVVLIVYLAQHTAHPGWVMALGLVKLVALAALLAIGVQLLRGRTWAQQVLLVVWMLVLADAVVLLLGWLVAEELAWWRELIGWPLPAVVLPLLAASVAASVLLYCASAASSRLRYASTVSVSVVVAIAAAVAVNVIAQETYVRRDIETFGRYGLSGRTKVALADLKDELTLTCVYTSADKDKLPENFRPRTWEQLEEIAEEVRRVGKKVKIENVTTVGAKARLDVRLRDRQLAGQAEHVKLLQRFVDEGPKLVADLEQAQNQWARMPAESYMTTWGVTANVAGLLKKGAEKVKQTRDKVQQELGSLPDCAKLVDEVKEAVKDTRDKLVDSAGDVDMIRKIPGVVAKRSKEATEALADSEAATGKMVKVLKDVRGKQIEDSAKVLKDFAAAARLAATKIRAAADLLADLAGEDNRQLILASRHLAVEVPTAMGLRVRSNLIEVLKQFLAEPIDNMAFEADATVKNAKKSFQVQTIERLDKQVDQIAKTVSGLREMADDAVAKLAQVDPSAQATFKQAEAGKLFASLLEPMTELLAEAEKLPKIESDSLSDDLTGDNIVIIELGKQTKVATFEDVWPRRQQGMFDSPGSEVKRVFNGDSILGSKILSMSHEQFATVVLTYFERKIPPQMRRQMPPSPPLPIPPQRLTRLRRALTEANFKVEDWNLAEDKPDLAGQTQKVLLVLPPGANMPMGPMGGQGQMPGFSKEHMDKIQKEIDAGTPAIFLALYLPAPQMPFMFGAGPQKSPYELLGNYLRDEWGIDVKSDYRLVQGNPDDKKAGRFKVSLPGFLYLPVSTFSDHPIGWPLRGRRVLWREVSPLAKKQDKPGVTAEPLLTVPAGNNRIWATRKVRELVDSIRNEGGLVEPHYAHTGGTDMATPMHLAFAAKRDKDEQAKRSASRVVVLGVGWSMIDDYLEQPVLAVDAKGGVSFDPPPTTNADLVVNSACWLIGREQFIAAGPALVAPIEPISKATENTLKTLCLAVLPLLVLAAGGLVLFSRRR